MSFFVAAFLVGTLCSAGVVVVLYRIELELKRVHNQLLVNFMNDQQNHESLLTNLMKAKFMASEAESIVKPYIRLLESHYGDSIGDPSELSHYQEPLHYPRENPSPIPAELNNCLICDEPYDEGVYQLSVLATCGHPICHYCSKNLLRDPFDSGLLTGECPHCRAVFKEKDVIKVFT